MSPLGLNRGTTDGACFFVFAMLSLAHDSNCLVVEWDTFWFGFNHPLEICWVTPSLATALVYLSELKVLIQNDKINYLIILMGTTKFNYGCRNVCSVVLYTYKPVGLSRFGPGRVHSSKMY